MSEFIVLGLIPGTQLQITFVLWALLSTAVFVCGLVWIDHKTHAFRNWVVAANVFILIRSQEIKD